MAESLTFCEDCMAVMARHPDKYFDLAVVDPPYGGGSSQTVQVERGGLRGGAADFEDRPRSRFGGWFGSYHIGGPDGRRLGCENPKTTQGADIRHWDVAPPREYFD